MSHWHRAVEAEKITSKEELSEIDKWSDEVESQMEEADQKIGILKQWLSNTEVKREDQQRKEHMDFELKLEEAKIKLKAEFTKVEAPVSEISIDSINLDCRLVPSRRMTCMINPKWLPFRAKRI